MRRYPRRPLYDRLWWRALPHALMAVTVLGYGTVAAWGADLLGVPHLTGSIGIGAGGGMIGLFLMRCAGTGPWQE